METLDKKQDQDHLVRFVNHIRTMRGLSPVTVEVYRGYCKAFLAHLHGRGQSLLTAGRRDVEAFLSDRMAKGTIKPNGNHLPFAAIKQLFRFMRRDGLVSANPTEDIELPRRRRVLPAFLSEGEMEMVISNLPSQEDYFSARFRAMFMLLYAAGLRISELVRIRLWEINMESRIVRVTGKRDKERLSPFSEIAADELTRFMGARQSWLVAMGYSSEYLFPTWDGRPLTTGTLRDWMTAWRKSINFNRQITPHMIRHSFATHLINGGADVTVVQKLLGHEDISTTQIYTHVAMGMVQKVYDRSHPQGMRA
jgi:integrase/recombinase XerD